MYTHQGKTMGIYKEKEADYNLWKEPFSSAQFSRSVVADSLQPHESQFSIIPSKEIPGLISFRMDWLDLLAVQGTLKSLV